MSFDEKLAARIRKSLAGRNGVVEKRMFGGVAFLLRGHMFCGIVGSELMVRVGPDAYAAALAEAGVRPMDFTGKPLKGYVFVSGARDVSRWVERGAAFVETLPPKKKRA